MDDDREDNPKVRPLRVWPIVLPLVVVPALYVLSMGPAVMLRTHGVVTQEDFLWFYAPVIWIYSRSAYVNLALEWYLQFWD
jgi:hypothetical protein